MSPCYGEKLAEMLRDRLVCGIGDDRIQRRLLSEPDLTFGRALKLAQAIETASKDVRDLHSLEAATLHERMPQTVHKMAVRQSSDMQLRKNCDRCGSEQHRAGDCRFANESCHKCGKTGHIQKVCRSTGPPKGKGGGVKRTNKPQGANYVSQGVEEIDEPDTEEVIHTLQTRCFGHTNGRAVCGDTGS